MALPAFQDVIADPKFSGADPARQKEINDAYWKAYEAENPTDQGGLQLRDSASRAIEAKALAVDAPPIARRSLEVARDAANLQLRTGLADRAGAFKTSQDRDQFLSVGQEELKQRWANVEKTNSLFTPEVEDAMKPTWDTLTKRALDSGYFGEQSLKGKANEVPSRSVSTPLGYPLEIKDEGKSQSTVEYERLRDSFAKDFNLSPDEADDLVQHRMGLQKDPVSRDVAGGLHIKDEVLMKGPDGVKSAVDQSSLPPRVKEKLSVEAPQRVALFKDRTIQGLKENHPELASEIQWTGDVEKDYSSLIGKLNKDWSDQLLGGVEAYASKRASQLAIVPTVQGGPITYETQKRITEGFPDRLQESKDLDAQTKRLESINAFSQQFNKDRTSILGVDAAVVGSGLSSAAESVAVGAVTGGAGTALISADRIAKAGTVGKIILGGVQRGLNTAPIAAIYGADQALSTYEDAINSKDPTVRDQAGQLAAVAFATEAGITTVFGAVKLGGTEDIGQRLVNAAIRAVGKSVAKAWGQLGLDALKGIAAENLEELSISAVQDIYVNSQLNPGMTVDDFKNNLKATLVATTLSTGPLEALTGINEQGTNLIKSTHDKSTTELHDTADAIYKAAAKENLPENQTPGGTRTKGSGEAVAGAVERKMTPAELSEAVEYRKALTNDPEEKKLLETGTPEEIASNYGITISDTTPLAAVDNVQPEEALTPKISPVDAETAKVGEVSFETTDTTVRVRDDLGEVVGERPAKAFTATDPSNDSRAIGTLDGETLQVTDIRAKSGNDKVTGSRFFERVVRAGQQNGATQVRVNLQSQDTRAVLKRLVDKGVLTNPRENTGISVDLHPTLFDITPAETSPVPDSVAKVLRDEIAAPEDLITALADVMGLSNAPIKVQRAETPGKLIQGELFQNPESSGDSNAVGYIRSFKGSPPKGATRALIDYAGDELLNQGNLGDLPTSTVKDIQDANALIQQAAGKGGRVRVGRVRFNDFLSRLWKRHHRGKKPGWHNFQSRRDIREMGKILAFEISHALSKDGSGVDWYRSKIEGMYSSLAKAFPELANDGQERFLFSVILAVTSNGQSVLDNLTDSIRLYREVRGKDLLPTNPKTSRSERNAAVVKAFREINSLIKENGWEQTKKDLLAPMTVSELKKKYGLEVTGELANHKVIGAMIMGPKIGSFWGNLNGHYDSITMDLWFTRTMNRLSGDTSTISPETLSKEIEKLMGLKGLPVDVRKDALQWKKSLEKNESWTRVPSDIREEIEFLYDFVKATYNKYSSDGFKDRSDINKIAKSIVKEIDGGEDSPDNGHHRQWMRSVVQAAQDQLSNAGVNITNADLQAILWFHEKDLYTRFGATTTRGERTDYTTAAEPALRRAAREGAGDELDTAGDAGRSTGAQAGPVRGEQLTLFQGSNTPKGQVDFRGMSQALITLFKTADISTAVHEMAHVARRFLFNRSIPQKQRLGITDEDIATAEAWAGAKDGVWSVAAEEKWARGFERYIRDGKFPDNAAVAELFQKLAKWLQSIYKVVSNSSIDVEVTPEIRSIFDKLVTRGVAPTPAPAKKPAAKKPSKELPAFRGPAGDLSLQKKEINAQLERAGLSGAAATFVQTNPETWDMALAKIASDPRYGSTLVNSILNGTTTTTDTVDRGVLLHEYAVRKVALSKAYKDYNDNPTDSNRLRMEAAQADMISVTTASKTTASEVGRALQFQKYFTPEDFTVEAMETRYRAEINDGAPLSADQRAEVAKLRKEIVEAQSAREALEAQLDERGREVAALMKKLEEKKPRAKVERKTVTERMTERAVSARDRLRARFGETRLEQAEDTLLQLPELSQQDIDDFGDILGSYLVNGLSEDAALDRLSEEFGKVFEEHLDEIVDAARAQLTKASAGSRAKTPNELFNLLDPESEEISNKLVYNMVRGFINQGVDKEKVLNKVLTLLNKKFPDLTYDTLSDIFTSYGKIKFPSQEEDLKSVRELRNIERIKRQIRELEVGNVPKKTGQQRDAATARIRELQKELKEAFRAAGIKHTTSATQLKGALDSIKSRLRNEIEDLDRAIATRTKIVRKKTNVEYDDEIKQLRAKREQRRSEYDSVFGVNRKAMTDAQRLKATTKLLTARIAEEQALASRGIVERVKTTGKPVSNAEVDRLRATLRDLVKLRTAAKAALHPSLSEEGRAISRAKKIAQRQIAHYEALKAGKAPSRPGAFQIVPGEELAKLWTLRDELKASIAASRKELRKLSALSPEGRARRAMIKALERSVKDLEARAAKGDISKRSKAALQGPLTADEIELKKRQQAAQEVLKALREAQLPTAEQRRENSLVKASETRRKKIEARIAANDYVKAERIPRVESSKLAAARLAEAKALEAWNRGFFEKQLRERSKLQVFYDGTKELLNFSRTMKTIADVSAVFRQGMVTFLGHPVLSIKAIPGMFSAGFSEVQAQRIKDKIEAHPLFGLSQQAKLFLADTGPEHSLSKIEEAFRGRWAKKIPGVRNVVNFSERTYNTYLNSVRMAHFASMVNGLSGGTPTVKEAKIIADFVNKATGRGDLKGLESSAAGLAAVFFSPKFVVSRFQILLGAIPTTLNAATGFQTSPRDIRRARKAVAKEYARLLIGISSVYTLAALAKAGYGDDDDKWIELDPRSSSFGKIKIGKISFDPMGGLLQAATFASRVLPTTHNGVWSPYTKTAKGDVVSLRSVGFGKQDYFGTVSQFLRTKLSPVPAMILNTMQGEDVIGQPVTVRSEAIGSVIPLVFGDVWDIMKEGGASGTPLAVAAMFGLGVQVKNDELELEQWLSTFAGAELKDYEKKSSSNKHRRTVRRQNL